MKKFITVFTAVLLVFTSASCETGSSGSGGNGSGGNVPAGVTARAQSSTTIYLSWTGITNEDKYTVYRVSDAGPQQFDVHDAYDYTDTGLAADTLYSYQVSATKGGVEGARSATVQQKTFPEGTIPVPGQVAIISTSVNGAEVAITWAAGGGASSYTLERGANSSGPWTEVYKGASTSYTDSGLQSGNWYYHVAASNSSGLGPWSAARLAAIGGSSGANPNPDPGTNPPSGVPGVIPGEYTTLAQKLAYIGTRFDNGVVYDITVDTDASLPATTINTMGQNVTINLHSASAGNIKTVSLSGTTGYLFTVSSNITLKLENIKLQGSPANNVALIRVGTGGTLILDTGSEITGNNTGSSGSGIFMDGGTLTMLDGKISGNGEDNWGRGGGVYVGAGGRFTMHGGTINGNKGHYGGGVFIYNGGYFAKTPLTAGGPSGIIYGNDVGAELANDAGSGDAVYYNSGYYKRNTTLGGFDVISTDNLNVGWE